jgi:hypothetical protein
MHERKLLKNLQFLAVVKTTMSKTVILLEQKILSIYKTQLK